LVAIDEFLTVPSLIFFQTVKGHMTLTMHFLQVLVVHMTSFKDTVVPKNGVMSH